VDSHVSDSVVHVDRQTTWTDAALASIRPSDHHVSGDEIFEILNVGSDGETLADRCAAKAVTVPMYCVWKAKYRHLSLEELRKVRRREHWRARCLLGVLLAAAVLAIGGIVFGLARAAQMKITAAAEPQSTVTSLPTTESAPAERNAGSDSQPDRAPARATEATPVVHESSSTALAPTTEPGYKIQVAAAPTVEEGRVLVARLATAGYPAYLFRATVKDTEVFRVRVGPFDTLPAAEEIASRLKRDGFNGAWIAR
jgi:cell division septation protein DedD